jgi:two-component system chemotaxis response regulator CheB
MPVHDIIVVGASAGGVEALKELVHQLPSGLPASLFIVCHFPPPERSLLPEILSRAGTLLANHARNGELFYPGHIYVAPPNHHLLLGPEGRIRLSRGARENNHRPAIDPLFRSAARYYGARVMGVILSGSLRDGAAGLLAVRSAGGIAIIQDPGEASFSSMPQSAAQIAGVDYVAPVASLGPLLVKLIHDQHPAVQGVDQMDLDERMPEIVNRDMERQARDENRGQISVFTCPECGGALWQVDEPEILQFRCHVGHTYDSQVLLSEQAEALEAALWTAVRTFREQSILSRQIATQERSNGRAESARRFEEQSDLAAKQGKLIQGYLLKMSYPDAESDAS